MIAKQDLVSELDKLTPDELEAVLSELTTNRAKSMVAGEFDHKRGFAIWVAKQHLGMDSHIREVIYLPAGAPSNEVRMLDINEKMFLTPGDDGIMPVNMTPASSELPYHVTVADITPEQWLKLQQDSSLLPLGWSLADRVRIGRGRG